MKLNILHNQKTIKTKPITKNSILGIHPKILINLNKYSIKNISFLNMKIMKFLNKKWKLLNFINCYYLS
ncbi:hypothetical protein [Blattabacterium cuenoti]|uniref:Uncharacterized protein n=1 Tax=Blattabacterium cuenoti STAT TaxID=1457030 RepID=A0A224AB45_9FLAO|nr:hypothetical protein [Blattabacterium cuenoti]BBA17086.1 hypothetical protein STAT_150 [Blattabacterium cuenoti STAT]